jgi:hypothetical protein
LKTSTLLTAIALFLMVLYSVPLSAQTASAQPTVADVLKTVDQLVEQNRRLQEQNQELMKQIDSLRRSLTATAAAPATTTTAATTTAPAATPTSVPAEPGTVANASEPSSGTNPAGKKSSSKPEPEETERNSAIFGEFNPGRGFTVAKSEIGELNFSGYMAARYLNQLPPDQNATDHLGRPITVTPRNDFQFHRVMLFTQGWLFSRKFQYSTFVWTVQDTNQVAVGGALYYRFNERATIGAGWNAYPGTLSLQGSHPYWTSYDRVMSDEFFRPFFSQGVFGQGRLVGRLEYRWMVGNNNSNLDVPATKLDRKLSAGGSLTWLPTTGEFGPRGAFGDYENHEKAATRFNLAYTYSPEDRQSSLTSSPGNTTLRLADSLNVFDANAFGNGVTVDKVTYKLLSAGAGVKYRGFFLQGEGYYRRLDNFIAEGRMPVNVVRDTGFYAQLAYMVMPRRIEAYGTTSYVFSNYGNPKEFIVGGNYYPWDTRNLRLNIQLINVDHSPVSSTFGFYTGKLTGKVVSIGFTALY